MRAKPSLLLMLFLTPASLALGQFDQPDNKHSTISTSDGGSIKDSDFAAKIQALLTENDESRVADAKFFFQQCYGGGFLDDVNDAMGDAVKWVGGSASDHDECSIGEVSEIENLGLGTGGNKRYSEIWEGEPPFNYWGRELIEKLDDDSETIKKNLEDTRDADPTGPNQGAPRGGNTDPQIASGNGGENIKLGDPAVTSHHAILWAGNPNAERHFNTVNGMYDRLVDTWGDPANNSNVTITVLFGNGSTNSEGNDLPDGWDAMAATEANLDAALAEIRPLLNENEQFLFYADDHGGTTTDVIGGGSPDAPRDCDPSGGGCDAFFELSPGEVLGMHGTDDNVPLLRINYEFLLPAEQPVPIFMNDLPIGQLDPLSNFLEIPIPEQILLPPLDPLLPPQPLPVDLFINNVAEVPIFWDFTEFDTGQIDNPPPLLPPLPELLPGDFNGDGFVDNFDLNLLLANWGAVSIPLPPGWDGVPPIGPLIDNDELNELLANWGASLGGSIPEPAAALVLVVGLAIRGGSRRH